MIPAAIAAVALYAPAVNEAAIAATIVLKLLPLIGDGVICIKNGIVHVIPILDEDGMKFIKYLHTL